MESVNKAKTNHKDHKIPLEILDDLASRFIINAPIEDRSDLIRICFQVEQAHWFYLDFYCKEKLTKYGISQFAYYLFQHIPYLSVYVDKLNEILNEFKFYKTLVPTYGAILMSTNSQVLLVQSFWGKGSWGFPKGKVNQEEDPMLCAIREVYEETGYDIAKLINPDLFIEGKLNDQVTRLYVVQNVPTETVFAPRTRMEIKSCEWFHLDDLLASNLFMVTPFVKRLKRFLQERGLSPYNGTEKNRKNLNGNGGNGGNGSTTSNKKRQRHKSMGDLDGMRPLNSISLQQQGLINSANVSVTVASGIVKRKSKPNINRQLFANDSPSDINGTSNFLLTDNSSPLPLQSEEKLSNSKLTSNKTSSNQLPKCTTKVKQPLVSIDEYINGDTNIEKWKNFTFDLSKLLSVDR